MQTDPLSLYIHIPFCSRKCGYCSFLVIADGIRGISDQIKDMYTKQLVDEIIESSSIYMHRPLHTIYIGGGTPTLLWAQRLDQIIQTIYDHYQTDKIVELSIECNPDLSEHVIETISIIQSHYTNLPRIRWSIGIQTLDNEILSEAWRWYKSQTLWDFFYQLKNLRQDHTSYNIDMIAFGKLQGWLPRNAQSRSYRIEQLQSWLRDHCSAYTLELFEWSQRYHQLTQGAQVDQIKNKLGHGLKKYGDDEQVYIEFEYLCQSLINHGYHRYELSNFAKNNHKSIHNQVYRHYGDYLWLWLGSSSKIGHDRRSNTRILGHYLKWIRQDPQTILHLSQTDYLQEQFFLALRTDQWLTHIGNYETILEANRYDRITEYQSGGYVVYDHDCLRLTHRGMDIYNHIITDLMR